MGRRAAKAALRHSGVTPGEVESTVGLPASTTRRICSTSGTSVSPSSSTRVRRPTRRCRRLQHPQLVARDRRARQPFEDGCGWAHQPERNVELRASGVEPVLQPPELVPVDDVRAAELERPVRSVGSRAPAAKSRRRRRPRSAGSAGVPAADRRDRRQARDADERRQRAAVTEHEARPEDHVLESGGGDGLLHLPLRAVVRNEVLRLVVRRRARSCARTAARPPPAPRRRGCGCPAPSPARSPRACR